MCGTHGISSSRKADLSLYGSSAGEQSFFTSTIFTLSSIFDCKKKGRSRKEICSYLQEAIGLTRPDYMDNETKTMLFSIIEGKIIFQLYLLHDCGEKELYRLVEFMEKYYDDDQKELSLFPIYLQLIKEYEQKKRYHELIDMSQKAIRIKSTGRRFDHLADLYFCQMRAMYQLKYERKLLIEMCHHIYYVYMIEEDELGMRDIVKFCQEELKCRIIEREIL